MDASKSANDDLSDLQRTKLLVLALQEKLETVFNVTVPTIANAMQTLQQFDNTHMQGFLALKGEIQKIQERLTNIEKRIAKIESGEVCREGQNRQYKASQHKTGKSPGSFGGKAGI